MDAVIIEKIQKLTPQKTAELEDKIWSEFGSTAAANIGGIRAGNPRLIGLGSMEPYVRGTIEGWIATNT